jgi:hypothetical protein
LQADGGRSVVDYESRAHIFGRNVELFGTRKTENETVRDDLIVPKFCARFNLLIGVHIVKGL